MAAVSSRALEELGDVASAAAGALLSVANEIARTLRLDAATRHCRPLPKARVLFDRTAADPALRDLVTHASLPVFTRWGLYCDDLSLKTAAVRPVRWILAHCPELRVRAVFGAGLDAEIVAALLCGPASVSVLARGAGAAYAATHEAVSRMRARGLGKASYLPFRSPRARRSAAPSTST